MLEVRKRIIDLLSDTLDRDDRVFAFWLEGSDGLGKTDAYSDLDIWLDVMDGMEEEIIDFCVETLKTIAEPDFVDYSNNPHPKIFQRNLHLMGTNEYLMIDLCVQSHSRGSEGCTFVKGDVAEYPFIVFDKANVIHIIDPPELDMEGIKNTLVHCKTLYAQRSRLTKYLKRNLYLEACAYFNKYVRDPLIILNRIIYTPRHLDYMLVHVTSHLPLEVVRQLEELYKIQSVEDIENRLVLSDMLYNSCFQKISILYKLD